MKGRTIGIGVVVGVSAVALTGCGQTSASTAPNPPANSGTPAAIVDYDRAKPYTSVSALTADSPNVAIVTALSGVSVQQINDLPFTRTPISVVTNLKGVLPAKAVVRQLGGPGITTSESGQSTLLQPGATYLLMLHPFELAGKSLANEYVVTGVTAGLYLEEPPGTGVFRRVVLTGPDMLPLALRAADVR